jgi:hypothetical protein
VVSGNYPHLNTELIIQSLAGFIYIQPALIVIPHLPKLFREETGAGEDGFGPDQFLLARCELCELLYAILEYNHGINNTLGDDDDITQRLKFYEKVFTTAEPAADKPHDERLELARHLFLRYAIPLNCALENNLLTNIRAIFSNVVVAIFRPLSMLEITLPDNLGSPRDICVDHCTNMMAQLEIFERSYPGQMSSGFIGALYLCYVVGFSLVGILKKTPSSQIPFTECCRHLSILSKKWPVAAALLTGLRATARQLDVKLPEDCLQYFKDERLNIQSDGDVPISFLVPTQAEMTELANEDKDISSNGVELGKIMAKWNSLSF